jgi:hypothetical protein
MQASPASNINPSSGNARAGLPVLMHFERSVMDTTITTITATVVPDSRRLDFMPKAFGARLMMRVESSLYAWMRRLCPSHTGGYWQFIELSNGGALFVPDGQGDLQIVVDGNGFDSLVSREVAGLIVTTFTLNSLLWQGLDELNEKYEQLLDFISGHPQCGTIRAALD